MRLVRSDESPSSALSSVVLPLPVPPLTRKDSRAPSSARSTRSPPGGTVPAAASSSRVNARGRTTRSDRHVQPTATGGQHRVQPGAVGQPGVHPRPGVVQPAPGDGGERCASRRTAPASGKETVVVRGRRPGPPRPGPGRTPVRRSPRGRRAAVPVARCRPVPTSADRRHRGSRRPRAPAPAPRRACATRAGVGSAPLLGKPPPDTVEHPGGRAPAPFRKSPSTYAGKPPPTAAQRPTPRPRREAAPGDAR